MLSINVPIHRVTRPLQYKSQFFSVFVPVTWEILGMNDVDKALKMILTLDGNSEIGANV